MSWPTVLTLILIAPTVNQRRAWVQEREEALHAARVEAGALIRRAGR